MKKSQDLSKTQIIIYLIIGLLTIYWAASDDLEDAGLISADKPIAVHSQVTTRPPAIPLNRSEIESISNELKLLHKAGVALHQDYNIADVNDMDALQDCSAKSQPLRTQAKALRPRAMALPKMSYRMNLTLAADAAFSCVYCSPKTINQCNEIPALLKQVEDLANEI